MYDFQRASLLKRISAAILDLILLVILATGFAFALSALLDYNGYTRELEGHYAAYEAEYGVSFDITMADYEAMTEVEQENYLNAERALSSDAEVNRVYGMIFNLTLVITTFCILLSFVALELALPLILGNGQTLGKKIFGIGVMRSDGIKITPMFLFVRTVLGKFTVETMIPVLTVLMIFFGVVGIGGTVLIVGLTFAQIVLVLATKARTPIHDKLASTVAVDLPSQMIFENAEELLEYKKRLHAESVGEAQY